ncbi:50S ribosomal protein L18e [Candidatus Pacearchaeota archaeon]|nr:50S ribosomal protein L18e [Candidatus Pacearchaeota archaeon]
MNGIKKAKVEKKLRRKTNPELVETIIAAKKNPKWLEIANLISRPKRKQISVNLDQINEKVKDGERVIVPGKILGEGQLNKKIALVGFSFSQSAKEKLKKNKIETLELLNEIKKNPEAKNIKIIRE